jgi:hypothetical protein
LARTPSTFWQGDVTKALKAAAAAGFHVAGFNVDVKTGKIHVVIGKSEAQGSAANPWDQATEELR